MSCTSSNLDKNTCKVSKWSGWNCRSCVHKILWRTDGHTGKNNMPPDPVLFKKLKWTFLSNNVTDFPAFGYIPGIWAILPGKNPCRAAGGWILMLALGIPGCPKWPAPGWGWAVAVDVAVVVVLAPVLDAEDAAADVVVGCPSSPDIRLLTISANTVSLFCWSKI